MGDCTLDKKSYKEVIAEDIKLVKQYIPDTFMLKTHILAVLHWSIDKQYPPEIWDKQTCPECKGEGYSFFVDQGEPDPDSKCDTCKGKGQIPTEAEIPPPPPPPPARLIREGKEPEKPPVKEEGKRSDELPKGFMFNSVGRVVLDPSIISNIED